ncbi:MAG: hypothetical protein IKS31_01340 [Clostridia bacterium]|nr:hypothetical protein [Clostridia bacterium]
MASVKEMGQRGYELFMQRLREEQERQRLEEEKKKREKLMSLRGLGGGSTQSQTPDWLMPQAGNNLGQRTPGTTLSSELPVHDYNVPRRPQNRVQGMQGSGEDPLTAFKNRQFLNNPVLEANISGIIKKEREHPGSATNGELTFAKEIADLQWWNQHRQSILDRYKNTKNPSRWYKAFAQTVDMPYFQYEQPDQKDWDEARKKAEKEGLTGDALERRARDLAWSSVLTRDQKAYLEQEARIRDEIDFNHTMKGLDRKLDTFGQTGENGLHSTGGVIAPKTDEAMWTDEGRSWAMSGLYTDDEEGQVKVYSGAFGRTETHRPVREADLRTLYDRNGQAYTEHSTVTEDETFRNRGYEDDDIKNAKKVAALRDNFHTLRTNTEGGTVMPAGWKDSDTVNSYVQREGKKGYEQLRKWWGASDYGSCFEVQDKKTADRMFDQWYRIASNSNVTSGDNQITEYMTGMYVAMKKNARDGKSATNLLTGDGSSMIRSPEIAEGANPLQGAYTNYNRRKYAGTIAADEYTFSDGKGGTVTKTISQMMAEGENKAGLAQLWGENVETLLADYRDLSGQILRIENNGGPQNDRERTEYRQLKEMQANIEKEVGIIENQRVLFNPDWDGKSAYQSPAMRENDPAWRQVGYEDPDFLTLYDAVNGSRSAADMLRTGGSTYQKYGDNENGDYDLRGLNDENRGIFNYLVADGRIEDAVKYLDDLGMLLTRKNYEVRQQSNRAWATESGGGYGIASFLAGVGALPQSAVESTGAWMRRTFGGEDISPYSDAFKAGQWRQDVKQSQGEYIKNNAFNDLANLGANMIMGALGGNREAMGAVWEATRGQLEQKFAPAVGEVLKFGYDAASSGTDSTFSMILCGGFSPAVVKKWITRLASTAASVNLQASEGATSRYNQELMAGHDPRTATLMGLTTYIFEMGTEMVGMEWTVQKIRNSANHRLLRGLTCAFAAESLEEFPGGVMERVADDHLNGDDSQFWQGVQQRALEIQSRNPGMSRNECERQAYIQCQTEWVGSLVREMAVAGFSTIGTTIGRYEAGVFNTEKPETTVDNKLRDMNDNGIDTSDADRTLLVDAVRDMNEAQRTGTAVNIELQRAALKELTRLTQRQADNDINAQIDTEYDEMMMGSDNAEIGDQQLGDEMVAAETFDGASPVQETQPVNPAPVEEVTPPAAADQLTPAQQILEGVSPMETQDDAMADTQEKPAETPEDIVRAAEEAAKQEEREKPAEDPVEAQKKRQAQEHLARKQADLEEAKAAAAEAARRVEVIDEQIRSVDTELQPLEEIERRSKAKQNTAGGQLTRGQTIVLDEGLKRRNDQRREELRQIKEGMRRQREDLLAQQREAQEKQKAAQAEVDVIRQEAPAQQAPAETAPAEAPAPNPVQEAAVQGAQARENTPQLDLTRAQTGVTGVDEQIGNTTKALETVRGNIRETEQNLQEITANLDQIERDRKQSKKRRNRGKITPEMQQNLERQIQLAQTRKQQMETKLQTLRSQEQTLTGQLRTLNEQKAQQPAAPAQPVQQTQPAITEAPAQPVQQNQPVQQENQPAQQRTRSREEIDEDIARTTAMLQSARNRLQAAEATQDDLQTSLDTLEGEQKRGHTAVITQDMADDIAEGQRQLEQNAQEIENLRRTEQAHAQRLAELENERGDIRNTARDEAEPEPQQEDNRQAEIDQLKNEENLDLERNQEKPVGIPELDRTQSNARTETPTDNRAQQGTEQNTDNRMPARGQNEEAPAETGTGRGGTSSQGDTNYQNTRRSFEPLTREEHRAMRRHEMGYEIMPQAQYQRLADRWEAQADRKALHDYTKAQASDGSGTVTVTGLNSTGRDATVTVERDGKSTIVPLASLEFKNAGLARVYEEASAYNDKNAAQVFLEGWAKTSLAPSTYGRAFSAIYSAARNGTRLGGHELTYARMLEGNIQPFVAVAGRKTADTERTSDLGMEETELERMSRDTKELPRKEQGSDYTGAVVEISRGRDLTAKQEAMAQMLDMLGKMSGTQIILTDNLPADVNGYFSEGNKIHVSIDRMEGVGLITAMHETWHYVREWATSHGLAEQVEAFEADIRAVLERDEDFNFDERVDQIQRLYKRSKGVELSREQAEEEIYANAMMRFADQHMAVDWTVEKYTDVAKKIAQRLKQWKNWIRRAMNRTARTMPEMRAMLQASQKDVERLADAFQGLVTQVYNGRETGELARRGSEGNRYQLGEPITYQSLISKPDMTIVDLSGYKHGLTNAETKNAGYNNAIKAGRLLKKGTAAVYVQDAGYEVFVTRSSLDHREETAARDDNIAKQMIGDLLKNSILINKSRPRDNTTNGMDRLLAIGKMGTEPVCALINVNHLTKEIGEIHLLKSERAIKGQNLGKLNSNIAALFQLSGSAKISIADALELVKNRFDDVLPLDVMREFGKNRRSTKDEEYLIYSLSDDNYMDAVERGDMETAQRMVEEKAEKAFKNSKVRRQDGKLLKMYHGTRAQFNEFRRDKIGSTGRFEGSGFNFTPHEGRAESYGGIVLGGYLDIQRPLSAKKKTLSVTKLAQLIREVDPTGDNIVSDYARETRDYGQPSFVRRESFTAARSVWDYAENDVDIYSAISAADSDAEGLIAKFVDLGYDGLIHYDENGEIKTAIAFDSHQFKKADPVTYDDQGNVIPLSERFNEGKEDIRYSLSDDDYMDAVERGDMEAAQRMVEEAANQAGYVYRAYHGTQAEFTQFDKAKQGNNYGDYAKGLFFFTNRKQTADNYAGPNGQSMDVWLKISNPLEVESLGLVNPIDYYDDHPDLLSEARRTDKDGIIVKGTGDYKGRVLYGVMEPNQIKSAETVTRDDKGNVIPLSERFNEEKKDIHFSLSEPVEYTRDLVAIHNLDERGLLEDLRMGGFPMPSIAVVNRNSGWMDYGPISVIFDRYTVDPQLNPNARLYGGDAYTPTMGAYRAADANDALRHLRSQPERNNYIRETIDTATENQRLYNMRQAHRLQDRYTNGDAVDRAAQQLEQVLDIFYDENPQLTGMVQNEYGFYENRKDLDNAMKEAVVNALDMLNDMEASGEEFDPMAVLIQFNEAAADYLRTQGIDGFKGIDENQDNAEVLMDILEETRGSVTSSMQEAKPNEVVDFSHVKLVLLPANASVEVRNALDDLGIEWKTYDVRATGYSSGDAVPAYILGYAEREARANALNEFADEYHSWPRTDEDSVLFSISEEERDMHDRLLLSMDEYNPEMFKLTRENEDLKRLISELGAELSTWRQKGQDVTDSKLIAPLARKIRDETHTTLPMVDLRANLMEIFQQMSTATTPAMMQAAMEAMSKLTMDALDNSRVKDSTLADQYEEERRIIRGLRLGKVGMRYAREAFGDASSARDALGFLLSRQSTDDTNNGNIEDIWRELGELNARFSPDTTNPADMLAEMVAFYNSTNPTYYNPYEEQRIGHSVELVPRAEMESAAARMATEIFRTYVKNGAKGTTNARLARIAALTDKVDEAFQQSAEARNLRELKSRYARRLQEMQTEFDRRLAEIQADANASRARALGEQRADLEDEMRNVRRQAQEDVARANEDRARALGEQREELTGEFNARRQREAERREASSERERTVKEILRHKGRILKKLQQPNTNGWVPTAMREAVTDLLGAIDVNGDVIEGKRELTAETIQRAMDSYQAIAQRSGEDGENGPMASYFNGDLISDFRYLLENAVGKNARRMDQNDLNAMRNVLAGYAAAIINADRVFTDNRRESLHAMGEDFIEQILEYMRKYGEKYNRGRFVQWLTSATSRGLIKPVTAFWAYRDTVLGEIYNNSLRPAEFRHIRNMQAAEEFFQRMLQKYSWLQNAINRDGTDRARREGHAFSMPDGRTVRLTDLELMTIYAWNKREQQTGTNHLLGGGFTLSNDTRGTSKAEYRLTPELIRRMTETLTDEQRACADEMVQYLSTTVGGWGNEVTEELYGLSKFTEQYYLPFSVNKNYVASNPAQAQDARIKTASFTKALTDRASTTLELQSFTSLWASHVEQMSDFNAFTLPMEDMVRLINFKIGMYDEDGNYVGQGDNVRPLMRRAWGDNSVDYIHSFLTRLNGNSRNEHGGNWINTMMGRAKGAAVSFNLSVAMQQMGAGVRALAEMDARDVAAGMAAVNPINSHKVYEELERWAPIAVEKSWGYFDTNMKNSMYERQRTTLASRANDAAGWMATKGDELNWGQIWSAVKHETRRIHPDLQGDDFYRAAAARFADVIDKTQVIDSVFQRAEWATEKGLMKGLMAFMSEPVTQYNMLYRSVQDVAKSMHAKDGTTGRSVRNLIRNTKGIVISAALTAFLKSLVSGLRDRKKEKKDDEGNIIGRRTWWDRVKDAYGANLADNFMGLLTIFGNMWDDATSSYSSGGLDVQWLRYANDMFKQLQKGEGMDFDKLAYSATQMVSYLTGVGFGGLYRDTKGVILSVAEHFGDDTDLLAVYDRNKSLDVRIGALEKNFSYSKEKADGRKVKTQIYTDLMTEIYLTEGLSDNFKRVADAAIASGANAKGLQTTFKEKLRAAEARIPEAAQALNDGDLETYSRIYAELQETGIGTKALNSMIDSEYKKLLPAEETETETEEPQARQTGADVVEGLREDEGGAAILNKALKAGDQGMIRDAVQQARADGMTEADIRQKLSNSFKKAWIMACYSGNQAEQNRIRGILLTEGSGIGQDDLTAWKTEKAFSSDRDVGLYWMIKEGRTDDAKKCMQYLFREVEGGQAAVKQRVEKWAKSLKAGSYDYDTVRRVLISIGFAAATVEKILKK